MKYLIQILIVFLAYSSYSQEKYEEYSCEYLKDQKPYEIKIHKNKKGEISFYIDGLAASSAVKKSGILINNEKELESFKSLLIQAKDKYIEWRQVAETNKVEKLAKKMDLDRAPVSGYWLDYKDWRFDLSVSPEVYFQVMDYDNQIWYLMNVKSGKMVSSSNKYIDNDGLYILFSNSKEIDEFISFLDYNRANEKLSQPSVEDLFKN